MKHLLRTITIALALAFAPAFGGDIIDRMQAADVPAPDLNYARKRVEELEKQIAARIAAEGRTPEPFTRAAIRGDINHRIIARTLLTAGIAVGPDGAVATLYGHTLADHADDVQQLLLRLPAAVGKVKDLNQNIGPQEIEQALKLEAEIDRFNRKAEGAAAGLKGATPRQVDEYLQSMLSPLAGVLKSAGGTDPVSTWLAAADPKQAKPVTVAFGPGQVQDLARRVHSAPLPMATREDLLGLIEMMRRGLIQPDLRPLVAGFYHQVEIALLVAEDLKAAEWLGPQVTAGFIEQLQTAIQLLKDPRTRDSAVDRLDAMLRSLGLARRLAEIQEQGLPADHLRRLFLTAHTMRMDNQDTRTADALLDVVDEFLALAVAYRELLGETPPPQFRPVLLQLRAEYQKAELKLLNETPELAANIALVTGARWETALAELEARLAQMQRVHRFPAWIEQMNKHKPRPAAGLFRNLRQLAVDLLDPAKRDAADRRLAALDEQIAAFDPMRFEAELAAPSDIVRHVTDDTYTLLLEQIERLRQDWATAWAGGTDETPAVERLAQMARLLRAIELAASLPDLAGAGEKLNAWAAWQANAEALQPVIDALPQRVQQASRFGAIGNWPALNDALEQLRAEVPPAMLVVTLKRKLGTGLEQLPGGVTGLLSQCLYPPRDGAFAAEHRLELAQISVYLLEGAHARTAARTPRTPGNAQARLAADYTAMLARKLLPEVR